MRPSTSKVHNSHTSLPFNSNFDLEDCQNLLRALEKQAFESVVYALRAQGPLTHYKELLLEHLKSALFIADDEFNVRMRLAANNPYLSRIAKELNPSSADSFSEWISSSYDSASIELAKFKKNVANNLESKLFSQMNQVFHEINKHNRSLPNRCDLSLLHLPRRSYVPERLRKLICDSESATNIDVKCKEETIKTSGPKNNVGRPRKKQHELQKSSSSMDPSSATEQKCLQSDLTRNRSEQSNHPILEEANTDSFNNKTDSPTNAIENLATLALSQELLPVISKKTDSEARSSSANNSEFPVQESASCKTSSQYGYGRNNVESSSKNIDNHKRRKKRIHKMRHADREETFDCARLRPFVFMAEQNKQIRGIQEPRLHTLKRSGNQNECLSNEVRQFARTYPQFHSRSTYYGQNSLSLKCEQANHHDRTMQIKRARIHEDLAHSPKESSTESMPSLSVLQVAADNITCNSASISRESSFTQPFNPPINSITNEFESILGGNGNESIVVNNNYSKGQKQNHILENALNNGSYKSDAINFTCASATPQTNDIINKASFVTTSFKNPVIESSGLDFLASTASLLGPIETINNNTTVDQN